MKRWVDLNVNAEGEAMKWCKECELEYEDFAEVCSDCDSELIPYDQKDLYKKKDVHLELKLLYTADSNMDAELICSLLHSYDIYTEIKRKGSGSYLNIVAGINYQGTDIYVSESDYSAAKDLLTAQPTAVTEVEENTPLINEGEYNRRRRDIVRFFLVISFGVPIALWIVNEIVTLWVK